MSVTTQEAQATADADSQSRAMFVARLENMQKNGDLWITVPAVLMLLNDCDMLASMTMDAACEGCGGAATHDVGTDRTALPGAYCNDCDPPNTPQSPQVPVDEREAWLPIETAPKDGTRLILWWGGKPVLAGWLDNSQRKHPWAGWQTPSLTPRPQGEPTHYMPLPPAPQTKGGEA